jgi:hypothetical protein
VGRECYLDTVACSRLPKRLPPHRHPGRLTPFTSGALASAGGTRGCSNSAKLLKYVVVSVMVIFRQLSSSRDRAMQLFCGGKTWGANRVGATKPRRAEGSWFGKTLH